ncbi:MAG: hypothetical protein QOE05_975 [Actinomycetota bacterium]|jgi:hypothetical protein|nr:hypothetical protein [Actinomycetota bacterium]
MPDISQLLTTAADVGYTELDLSQVERRSRVIRRRRRAVRSATAAGVAVIAVVLFRGAGAGPDALDQIPADRAPRPSTSPAPVPATDDAQRLPGGPAAARPGAGGSRVPTSTGSTPHAPAPAAEQRPTPGPSGSSTRPAGSFPPASSCSVGTTALTPGLTASCRFTSTEGGGYRLAFNSATLPHEDDAVSAVVEVFHDGRTTSYDAWSQSPYCRNAVIQVGDLVTVTVRQGPPGTYYDFSLGAGAEYRCAS